MVSEKCYSVAARVSSTIIYLRFENQPCRVFFTILSGHRYLVPSRIIKHLMILVKKRLNELFSIFVCCKLTHLPIAPPGFYKGCIHKYHTADVVGKNIVMGAGSTKLDSLVGSGVRTGEVSRVTPPPSTIEKEMKTFLFGIIRVFPFFSY